MPQTTITVIYPLIDVVMVGVVARLLLTGALSPALWLVAAGMLGNLVGDTAYSWLAATEEYEVGALPDQMWMLSMVLVGAAALHPSMRSLVTQVEDTRVGASRLRLLLLFGSLHVPARRAGRQPAHRRRRAAARRGADARARRTADRAAGCIT
jgi:hypothetical protein